MGSISKYEFCTLLYTKDVVKVILLFVAIILPSQILFAQENLRIKYYSLDDGLSQVSINDMLQDSLGFVWIATQNGVNRFDGQEFRHYRYKESDTTTISGNLTNKLVQDTAGNIWVGTIGNGLSYYNPNLDNFERIRLENSDSNSEVISALVNDSSGAIWAASRISGLHKLTRANDDSFFQDNYFENKPISALSLDSKQNLWVGTPKGEIYQFDLGEEIHEQETPFVKAVGHLQAFYHTEKSLLIGSDYGLFIYNLEKKEVKSFNLGAIESSPTRHVVSFLKQDEHSVWVGTGSGLYLFDWKEEKVISRILNEGDNGISNNTVQSLLRISDNKIFVGTANFLNLLDFSKPYFQNLSKNLRGSHVLNDNVIFSILKNKNDLWVGTSDGGLNLIRNGKSYYFKDNQNETNSISGSVIRAIAHDSTNDRLWLATTRGLNLINLKTFDPENPEFVSFFFNPENNNSISGNFMKDLVLDEKNNVWGVTYGQGIFRLEFVSKDEYRIVRYQNDKKNQNSLPDDFVHCIRVDDANRIWIGTQGGLSLLEFKDEYYKTPIFTNYSHDVKDSTSLSHNSVYDILIDSEERVWAGTRYGFNLLLQNNKFQSWTEQPQFTDAIVYTIQDDLNGNLWIGTNDGLVMFNPNENEFQQYNVADGIQSKEFDIHAKFRDKDGTLYLGGIGGVTYFNPKDFEGIDVGKPLYFTELKVKDKVLSPESNNSILKKNILNTNELEFSQNQFPFYLQFSSIDFRLSKQVEYGYKLLPGNQEWNKIKDPEVQFLNLPSGKHTLVINGFSRGLEWNQEPLKMNLTILPPWWATWWAYTSYLILGLALAFFFYRFQVSRKLAFAESKRLKEINQLKNSLYTNITHEFRTPLTVILGMAGTIKDKLKVEDLKSIEKPLEMIERNGGNLLQLVNEMLDLAKLESGNMELQLVRTDVVPLIKYICESFQSYAKELDVNLVLYSELDSLVMDIDEQKIQGVISNLLSNAIKFLGKGDKIIVHLNKISTEGKERLIIKVKDNGIGIAKDAIPHVFNRFYQADATISRTGEGTGIGLSLVKNFVELMGGSVIPKSVLGQGTEFVINLPITTAATQVDSTHTQLGIPANINSELNESVETPIFVNSDLPIALIIEDNADVAYFLKISLKDKYQIHHAENGSVGVEKALSIMPDVIICDVMMPVMDGYAVLKTLKTDKRTDHIPIIMLTAKVTQKDRLAGLAFGADAYLAKPFEKAELFTRLDQLVLLRKKIIEKFEGNNLSAILEVKPDNPSAIFIKEAIEIIHEQIENSNFGPKQLAFKLNLSESQTYRKLKSVSDKSTAVFIRSVRLQKAKEILHIGDKSVSQVAYSVGFNDPSWFSRAFKEEFGFTPSAIGK
ncbi:two-component regulator propeller domain-containing protein [Aurantibacter sp.]|uniref:hybrid sensor histidine kinase/response regulator transcription factor n=1 Tax=Aurantibacter sp. TaxID=2807103 RepID=UPI003264BE75